MLPLLIDGLKFSILLYILGQAIQWRDQNTTLEQILWGLRWLGESKASR
jgi:hypothetical protein